MKQTTLLLCIAFSCSFYSVQAQSVNQNNTQEASARKNRKHTMNFFVISKRKKGELDLATRYNIFRTKLKTIFHGKNFSPVVARNTGDMQKKIEKKLKKNNAVIGTIWFDSHGIYKKGYALFQIGTDEINYHSIHNSNCKLVFQNLSAHCSSRSKFIIGSCYGGATFKRLMNDYKDTVRMQGDSLMIALGSYFKNGTVYGSESWVMSRPGLFLRRLSVYGNPGRKVFHDKYYKPAWEHVGKWNKYNINTSSFEPSNAITLSANGKLIEFEKPYHLKKKYRRSISKIIANLQSNLLFPKS